MIILSTGGILMPLRQAYDQLLQTAQPFSLLTLLKFNFNDYCTNFHPHPQAQMLTRQIELFGRHYGIWLENAKHYISCALYLFPTADSSRMVPILKNCAVDFYLNDTIGREKICQLSQAEQLKAQHVKMRMAAVNDELKLPEKPLEIEKANMEMLKEIRSSSPRDWFANFLRLYNYHIETAHTDINASALGHVLTVEEYIELRNHVAGMPHTTELIQYSIGYFLDWEDLQRREREMEERIKKLNRSVCLIGCLLNDLFSFEKEVIDEDCDANLIAILMLNDKYMSLKEAIYTATSMVGQLLREFMDTLGELKTDFLQRAMQGQAMESVCKYIEGLEKCVQAAWVWQLHTQRYKRPVSIWKETQLFPTGKLSVDHFK